jgi:hypothetical protein
MLPYLDVARNEPMPWHHECLVAAKGDAARACSGQAPRRPARLRQQLPALAVT